MFGISASPRSKAYLGPFIAFMVLLGLGEAVAHFGDGMASWWVAEPKYWVFPLQSVICGILLAKGWRYYHFLWRKGWGIGVLVGVIVFGIWVSPQWIFGFERRIEGFEPGFFGNGAAYGWNVAMRFVRLVIVVPLLEEVFWRGFLLRHLIHDPFDEIPFGTFAWKSFLGVVAFFAAVHWGPDFGAAIITGIIYNGVAIYTRSLGACVLAHATTNLLLGIYILKTGQWGFW